MKKIAAPYPPGDYEYYESQVENNEVYHAVDHPETVIDIIQNGAIKPLGGRGAVSLTTSLEMVKSGRFGKYAIVLDWECLQSQNLGLFPLRYVDPADPEIIETVNQLGEESLKSEFPFIYSRNFADEEEIRSYSAVFVSGCIRGVFNKYKPDIIYNPEDFINEFQKQAMKKTALDDGDWILGVVDRLNKHLYDRDEVTDEELTDMLGSMGMSPPDEPEYIQDIIDKGRAIVDKIMEKGYKVKVSKLSALDMPGLDYMGSLINQLSDKAMAVAIGTGAGVALVAAIKALQQMLEGARAEVAQADMMREMEQRREYEQTPYWGTGPHTPMSTYDQLYGFGKKAVFEVDQQEVIPEEYYAKSFERPVACEGIVYEGKGYLFCGNNHGDALNAASDHLNASVDDIIGEYGCTDGFIIDGSFYTRFESSQKFDAASSEKFDEILNLKAALIVLAAYAETIEQIYPYKEMKKNGIKKCGECNHPAGEDWEFVYDGTLYVECPGCEWKTKV